MDVRIGVNQSMKEIELELAEETDVAALRASIAEVLSGKEPVLWLTDRRGREVAVSGERISWVEIGAKASQRSIGFSA